MLSKADFRRIVEKTPLVSIDLLIVNARGEVLLGLRRNEPAKGKWFVPGGRIKKNETIAKAFARIVKTELGVMIPFRRARLLGAFDHIYPMNALNEPGYGTHYVVLAYRVKLGTGRPRPDDQHHELRWWKIADVGQSRAVHKNTRAYFAR